MKLIASAQTYLKYWFKKDPLTTMQNSQSTRWSSGYTSTHENVGRGKKLTNGMRETYQKKRNSKVDAILTAASFQLYFCSRGHVLRIYSKPHVSLQGTWKWPAIRWIGPCTKWCAIKCFQVVGPKRFSKWWVVLQQMNQLFCWVF